MEEQLEEIQEIPVVTVLQPKIPRPRKWQVVLGNDDVTPVEFVVDKILVGIFNYSQEAAEEKAGLVHEQGSGVLGQYTRDIAKTKVRESLETAQLNGGFPLIIEAKPV